MGSSGKYEPSAGAFAGCLPPFEGPYESPQPIRDTDAQATTAAKPNHRKRVMGKAYALTPHVRQGGAHAPRLSSPDRAHCSFQSPGRSNGRTKGLAPDLRLFHAGCTRDPRTSREIGSPPTRTPAHKPLPLRKRPTTEKSPFSSQKQPTPSHPTCGKGGRTPAATYQHGCGVGDSVSA